MRQFKMVTLLLLLWGSYLFATSSEEFSNKIDLAKKQQILIQKVSEDLLAIYNDLNKEAHIEDLKKSRELFSKGLKKLISETKIPKIERELNVIDRAWQDIQPTLESAVKNENKERAIEGLDEIQLEMNRVVEYYNQSITRQQQRIKFASILGNYMEKSKILKKRVNLSGKQRMLIQRMTKLALLISSNIKREENIERLKEVSSLYNKTLNAFKNGDKDLKCVPTNNEEIQKQIDLVMAEWKPFYKNIQLILNGNDEDKKALSYLVTNDEKLLELSDKLVKMYEKSNSSENYLEKVRVHIVNVAGRERMLSQKMTKEKLLVMEGKGEYREKLKETISMFDKSLKALINGDKEEGIIPPSNEMIKNQLNKVAEIWKRLKPLYEKEKLSQGELHLIIKENQNLLSEMDKMVKMAEIEREY